MTDTRHSQLPRSAWTWLLLALAVGIFLRFFLIGAQQLWGDEAMTTGIIRMATAQVLAPRIETHPPFYFLVVHLWSRVFGMDLAVLRSVSALFSLFMIPLVFVLGNRLIGRKTALFAAWLMALSPLQVYYGQELRMYSAVALLGLASMFFFVRLLQAERPGWGIWVGYGVTTLAAMYTHYEAFALVAAQGAAALIFLRRDRKRLLGRIATAAGLAVAYLPWVLAQTAFLGWHSSGRPYALSLRRLADIAAEGLTSYLAGLTVPQGVALAATVLGLVLAALGAVHLARKPKALALLSLWPVASIGLWWLADPMMPFFHPRFVFAGAPALLLLMAAGLEWLSDRSRPAAVGAGALIVAVFAFSLFGWYTNPAYQKSQYATGIADVARQAVDGDVLLLNNSEQQFLYDFYRTHALPAVTLTSDQVFTPERAAEALSQATKGYRRVWLLCYGNLAVYDPNRNAEKWLAAHGYRAQYQSYNGFFISMYVLGEPPSSPPNRLQSTFEHGVTMSGYDVRPTAAQAGGTLLVTLYWQVEAPPVANYVVFAQLLDASGALVAQMDGEPAGGARPTSTWQPGETIVDSRAISLAPDLPAGTYTLQVGLYTWPDLARLKLTIGADALKIADITIE